jgi:cation:H+ antiporter
VLVALTTTLPEVVVTFGTMYLGAVNLAVGNLLGSVLVNASMLGILDLVYMDGPLLRAVGPEHAATGLLAMVMTGIAAAEMVYRPQKKTLHWLSTGAFFLAFLYVAYIFGQIMLG